MHELQQGSTNADFLDEERRSILFFSVFIARILNFFDNNSAASVDNASYELKLSRSTVWRTLHSDNRHPYHYTRVQEFLPADYENQLEFCQWYVCAVQQDNLFPSKVLWTDESTFTRGGLFNVHNNHVRARRNPHVTQTVAFQHQFKCNVWAGLYNDMTVGPYFLPNRLTSTEFLNFLKNELSYLLEDVPLYSVQRMWMQLDGCPAHYGTQIRQWLNNRFPQRWIGRDGSISWPPRSLDLTPLDFYLWGTLKEYE
nr:uncharacterized protein LOC117220350 [Megalopta genalis]